MKRKLLVTSLAMITGLPQIVFAKGVENGSLAELHPSGDSAYMPNYGSEGVAFTLPDQLAALPPKAQDAGLSKWRLEFALPRENLMGAQEPSAGKGARAGVSLKLDF